MVGVAEHFDQALGMRHSSVMTSHRATIRSATEFEVHPVPQQSLTKPA